MLCRLFRSRRDRLSTTHRTEHTPLVPHPTPAEPELYNAEVAEYDEVSTFAEVKRITGTSTTKIKIKPYFGPLAGRDVVFNIKRSTNGADRTVVYVDGERISTLLDLSRIPRRGRCSVRDTCINFVHDARRYDDDLPLPQPNSLRFCCTKHIHLMGVLPAGMCLRDAKKFHSTMKQEVVVRVWPTPRSLRTVSDCASSRNGVKLRVPMRISFSELGWYLKEKLSLPTSSHLRFREPDRLEDLQNIRPLMLRHTVLDCFVSESPPQSRPPEPFTTTSPRHILLPVMLVGCGIEEIVVTHSTTVVEFEHIVTQQFQLSENSFLYIPSLFTPRVCKSTGLKMYTTASRRSSLNLLDRHSRRFPIVSESDPNLLADYRELRLYNSTLADAGLLYEDNLPLVCFNVTGPTVPLVFKAISPTTTANSGSSGSSGATDCGTSNFLNVSEEPRILSINPTWTTSTLLKYVFCVSSFSCRKLTVNNAIVAMDVVIGTLFDRDWIIRSPNGKKSLSPNVPKALS